MSESISLVAQPLTKSAFAPYGDVVEIDDSVAIAINDGSAKRYDQLATIELAGDDSYGAISIFVGQPRPLPFQIRLMERHPLGSQSFVPLDNRPYLVVVAPDGDYEQPGPPVVFIASGEQGVHFRMGLWHHPLLTLTAASRFLVVDRAGPGENCEVAQYDQGYWIDGALPSVRK